MRLLFIACLHGLGLFQLVASQGSRTAWAPPTQAGAGLGPGIAPPDFTEYQNNMAIVQINAAATEEAAVRAATAVYNPMLDMSDAVQNALEDRIRQLRTPPGWTHRIPPPLPHNFDPMHLVMAMYYGQPLPGAPGAVGPAPVAPPPVGRTLAPQAGPPTSIRRGPPPPGRAGNRNRNRSPIVQNNWMQAPQPGPWGPSSFGGGPAQANNAPAWDMFQGSNAQSSLDWPTSGGGGWMGQSFQSPTTTPNFWW